MVQHLIRTNNLLLRPFESKDAAALHRMCNDPTIAQNTETIPFPYTLEHALQFLGVVSEGFRTGKSAVYAITSLKSEEVVGTIGLNLEPNHQRALLGYYIAAESRGNGFASEAATGIVKYGFEKLNLQRIYAYVFTYNPASAKVLENAGLQREGLMKGHFLKNGKHEDEWVYGIVK
jgi:[ribosomal protein S5]-alanine N-acetyltransferase